MTDPVDELAAPQMAARDHILAAACVFGVFAGVLKGTVILSWSPVDPTLVTCVFLLLALAAHVVRAGSRLRVRLSALILLAALVPPFFPVTPWLFFGAKVQALLLSLLIVTSSVYLVGTPIRRRLWLRYLAVAGVVTVVLLFILPSDPSQWGRAVFEGSNTIATGRMSGVAVMYFACMALFPGRPALRLAAGAVSIVSAYEMLQTGSRGPLLGAVIALVIVALRIRAGERLVRLASLASLFIGGAVFLATSTSAGAKRIEDSLTGQISSTGTRDPLWDAAWRYLSDLPSSIGGTGWGGFGSVLRPGEMLDSGIRQYPHDVFLEVFIEGGWLTGSAISIFLIASLLRAWRAADDRDGIMLLSIVVFMFVNACVSGDVNDNRVLWVAIALTWTISLPVRSLARKALGEPHRARGVFERRVGVAVERA